MSEEKLEDKSKEEKQEESKVEKLSEKELNSVGGGGGLLSKDTTKPEPNGAR